MNGKTQPTAAGAPQGRRCTPGPAAQPGINGARKLIFERNDGKIKVKYGGIYYESAVNFMEQQARLQIHFQKETSAEIPVTPNAGRAENGRIRAVLTEESLSGCTAGRLELQIVQDPEKQPEYLAKDAPVRVYLPMECPERITAMYMFNPWWTRPAFVESFAEIPDRTQIAFFKYRDACACFLPMAGDTFKAVLTGGTGTELCLEMSAGLGGYTRVDEIFYLFAKAPTVAGAVHTVFAQLAKLKGIRLREERRLPEPFRFLGWCSWDAFRTDVNETGIRQKAAELSEKRVPVKWMLIDDGWFTAQGRMLAGFAPDAAKFPSGFAQMTADIQKENGVKWFGVWHALAGYWDGIAPESALAAQQAAHLYQTVGGRLVPSPETGAGFYEDWYRLLSEQGIRFVKVDGQSSAPFYFENSIPVSKAVRGLGAALERGAYRMDNAVINCMGMAMENIAARPVSAVSRNSDDFVPQKEGGFTEHLLQNAYNAIYHNELYCCDWDMFWTNHPDAARHALLRAISGGPVYFSDRLGDTVPEVLQPLIYPDGRVLMMDRSARPTDDCIFTDPAQTGVLKLHNAAPWGEGRKAGGIAVYNLTAERQAFSFAPADIPELEACDRYWVYDFLGKTACSVGRNERYQDAIEAGAAAWYVVLPQSGRLQDSGAQTGDTQPGETQIGITQPGSPQTGDSQNSAPKTGSAACLGLLEKYVGFTAVESSRESETESVFVLHARGTTGWLSEKAPRAVKLDGADVTDRVENSGYLWELPLAERSGKTVLSITW